MAKYICLSFFVLIFFSFIAYAQNDDGILNIDVEGRAVIKQNDIAGAREEAIGDALGNSVLAAASNILSIPVKDEKFQPVRNALTGEWGKYISFYKISAEIKEEQAYAVNVNATVVLASLKKDLDEKGLFQLRPVKEENSPTIFLNVRGLKKYADYLNLKEFLKSRDKMIVGVYPCRFAWQQMECEIKISGKTQIFADELIKKTGYILIDIKETDKNHVEINCMPKQEN